MHFLYTYIQYIYIYAHYFISFYLITLNLKFAWPCTCTQYSILKHRMERCVRCATLMRVMHVHRFKAMQYEIL